MGGRVVRRKHAEGSHVNVVETDRRRRTLIQLMIPLSNRLWLSSVPILRSMASHLQSEDERSQKSASVVSSPVRKSTKTLKCFGSPCGRR